MVAVFSNLLAKPRGLHTGASIWKFPLVDTDWRERFPDLKRPEFDLATVDQLSRVHSPDHVAAVLAGNERTGYGTRDVEDAMSELYDVSAFLAAARHTAKTGERAVSIGGGFHHAGYARSHAFCTFNGLMVAAMDLIDSKLVKRVAILDLDHHFGDGTQDIRTRLGVENDVLHYVYAHKMLDRNQVDDWLDGLGEEIRALKAAGANIVLYNAGVDSHVDDPMARGVITTEQMQRREKIVFGTCADVGLPVAWTLAGGYQHGEGALIHLHGLALAAALDAERMAG